MWLDHLLAILSNCLGFFTIVTAWANSLESDLISIYDNVTLMSQNMTLMSQKRSQYNNKFEFAVKQMVTIFHKML